MEPRRVLISGARGHIGGVLRPGLCDGLEELRLSDLEDIEDREDNGWDRQGGPNAGGWAT